MPFVFAFFAIALLAIGVRGQANNASKLLADEFTGSNSFIQWFLAIMILGLLGYYKPIRAVADAMLGLVIVAIVLVKANPNAAGGGFFAQLEAAFQNTTALPNNPVAGSSTVSAVSGADNSGGTSSVVGNGAVVPQAIPGPSIPTTAATVTPLSDLGSLNLNPQTIDTYTPDFGLSSF